MVGWGFLLAILWLVVRRGTPWAALVIIGVVLSHWVLDAISHQRDLPLTVGGEARVGFGLWNSLPATLAVEGLLFALGVWLYARFTKALDGIGRWGFWALVIFLVVVYVVSVFGPLPERPEYVVWAGHALWLLVAWGYWIDRHRARIRRSAITGKEI
jgi:hypothetical protein